MKRVLALACLLILVGCDLFEHHYSEGVFPETTANLGDINSPDDDYNSTSHVVGNVIAFVFSSKRGGRSDFNLIHESLNTWFDLNNGKFTFDNHPYGGLDAVIEQNPLIWATGVVNSSANELGPYIRSYAHDLLRNDESYFMHNGEYLMLFASDRTGNLDIYLTHNYQDSVKSVAGLSNSWSNKQFGEPVLVPFLNSSADDGYPTFDQTYRSIYFTSNRGGSFDIYRAMLPTLLPTELHARLPTLTNVPIERIAELSTESDDKCPFISGNTLVFTSNRPGGYGGYDLYYSKWDGDHWSAPVNFGGAINTSYDEYRPILCTVEGFGNQLMIFSSNRPGGKGGFDLYRVGVPK
ncbi:PD40 domain-containing protein [Spirosoma foliorum]|uniref:PD40 domain-containing protein n=1 Tax=Spirosoma foliorum TaxID=2710596 RepID=A0A7G5GVM3_9BACT|nr:PD40 domain-containing protein [Spirosoma foliorum]QMW02915.1 PD40 domain-containing protein [Spirosoma foliorum]